MKILHVIDSGGFYGAEVMLVNLVSEQLRQGLEPLILSIGDPGIAEKALEAQSRSMGLPLEVMRFRPGLNLLGARRILHFSVENGFNLIHSHGYKANILLGLLPGKARKTPLLSTLHGWTGVSWFSRMRYYEVLDALSFHYVDGLVLVNRKILENPQISRLKPPKLFVVDNGIPLEESTESGSLDRDIVNFCEGGHVIVSIGRFSVEKGFDLLLRAFVQLVEKIPHARLLLLGEGGQRPVYEAIIASHKLEGKVMLAGYRPQACRFLALAQTYVVSSLTEGLPITLLEALRAGVPVVATRVGGIPEVLKDGECGLLVEPGSSSELACAMLKYYNFPGLAKAKGDAGLSRFRNRYSSRTMAAGYLAVYKNILGCRE